MRRIEATLAASVVIAVIAACSPDIPWSWTAYTLPDSIVVWLPPSFHPLPPGGPGPQFADSDYSVYLVRVPATQLYEPWLNSRSTSEGPLVAQERTTDTVMVHGRRLVVERAVGSGLIGRPPRQKLIAVHIPLDGLSGAVLFSAYDGDADRTLIAIAATVSIK